MKTKFTQETFRSLFTMILCLTIIQIGYSQKIKGVSPTQTSKNAKGFQLYKQIKVYDSNANGKEKLLNNPEDKVSDRLNYEYDLVKDPNTGKIPEGILNLERSFSKKIPISNNFAKPSKGGKNKKSNGEYWVNRGPFNVGGRTRALAIDIDDENIIIAGGVSGGVWRSENGGRTWDKVTRNGQSPSITAIVQDPRLGYRNVWYYGSGENSGNSARATGAFYNGTGVYKSIDGGRTWNILPATFNVDNNIRFASPFENLNSMAVNPNTGDLYLATINGILRSKNGGKSFKEVLKTGFGNRAEVMITPQGLIYVTIASGRFRRGRFVNNPNKGFFVSINGDNWTDITPTNIVNYNAGRTVMSYNALNENIVYFFSHNYNNGEASKPYLVKYDALGNNASEKWVDLSENLPVNIDSRVGDLNLQGSYNMFIRIKPDNPNFIVLGGTNIYRSTTGFTTPAGFESWIGGYFKNLRSYNLYANHHPDQHNFIFYPSNPNKALSSNDGGVQVTEDITATLSNLEPVKWKSLNHGYLTTQAYTVSFNPKGKHFHKGSMNLLVGLQDNGTWFTNSRDSKKPWVEDLGGDGSYNAIADNGRTRYVSFQNGAIMRLNFDENGEQISSARIQPLIANNPTFVQPFILDPINDNIMYLPDGNRMLRNSNLDEIPVGSSFRAIVNWKELKQTVTPDRSRITALDISVYPQANQLYYGTSNGGVYRMNNANLDNQTVVDISSGKGLPKGNIINIVVDPSNNNRVVIVFSNYGIPSLFLTENSGETWTDISSNLEEKPDGSGNGPSVRWFAFFGNGQAYFAATSTGLYSTYKLDGNKTLWARETRIGNNVVRQIKTRRDGFMAVATHGNGVSSARFPIFRNFQVPKPTLSVTRLLPNLFKERDQATVTVDINELFKSSNNSEINIELTNSNPSLIKATLSKNIITINYNENTLGEATIGLIATSGEESVSEGFTVFSQEPRIYEQVEPSGLGTVSQFFTGFNGLVQSADDFIVPQGNTWSINKVIAYGSVNGEPVLNNATVIIYNDLNGKPGEEIFNSGEIIPISASDNPNLNLELPESIELENGTYWITVYENLAYTDSRNLWFWANNREVKGYESVFKDEKPIFRNQISEWTNSSTVFNRQPLDMVFQLFGVVSSIGNNETESSLAEVDINYTEMAWPNPSNDYFNFDINSLDEDKVSIKIYNLSGQLLFEKKDISTQRSFIWNASHVPSGIYLVNIKGNTVNYKGKLIKK